MEIKTEQLAQPDTYNHRLTCGNCTSPIGLKIPLGGYSA